MINSSPLDVDRPDDDDTVAAVVRSGPLGGFIIAALATAGVVALWFAFYLFVFLPRAAA